MDVDHAHFSGKKSQVLLLHEFGLGHKAVEAGSSICSTMDENVFTIRRAKHWFKRFKNGNFELDNLTRTGRSLEPDVDRLCQLIRKDSLLSSWCLAKQFECSYSAAENF